MVWGRRALRIRNRMKDSSERWEDVRSLEDNSDEILRGLKRSPGGLGRSSPKKMRNILDVGFNNGRSVLISGNGETLEIATIPIIELKGDDEVARGVVITLQSELVTFQSTNELIAKLEWGSGGFQANAEVDILNGVSVNLHCSWVRVTAGINAILGAQYKVGAFASYGNTPPGSSPQKTAFRAEDNTVLGTIGPGATSKRVIIPQFANTVMLVNENSVAATDNVPYSLKFLGQIGGILHEAYFNSATGSNSGFKAGIPIPWAGNAKKIEIRNRDGALSILKPRLIFGLSL